MANTPTLLSERINSTSEQGLLVVAEEGMGAIADIKKLIGRHLFDVIEPTDTTGSIDYEKGSIRIKQIRDIYPKASTKGNEKKVFLLVDADTMQMPAQNAFLKLLEEPPENVRFVMVARTLQTILPTVRSRVEVVHVTPMTNDQSAKVLADVGVTDQKTLSQIAFVAGGLPELMKEYAKNPALLQKKGVVIQDAKQFLSGTQFERIQIINRYASDRTEAKELLEAAKTLLEHTMRSTKSPEVIKTLSRLADTYSRINANGNTRIQLLSFVLY